MLFCFTNIWATLQEGGGETRRNLWRERLIHERPSARDGLRIISEQNAEGVFFVSYFPFQFRNCGVRSVKRLLQCGPAIVKSWLPCETPPFWTNRANFIRESKN